MKNLLCAFFLSLAVASCGGGSSSSNEEAKQVETTKIAQDYLWEVIDIMRNHAITRYEVDWGALESEVSVLAANAKTIEDTYPAIERALELLGTNHSFLKVGNTYIYPTEISCSELLTVIPPVEEDIGYIAVGGFSSSNKAYQKVFASDIQKEIEQQDSAGLRGWIVDLRDNSGGNMWPMIAGLGPLLGDGVHGHFIDPDENISEWGYRDGGSFNGTYSIVTLDSHYEVLNPTAKIAVLSSRRVASSGEATLIAFKKLPNVKIFGNDSCGLSTANRPFSLSDGSTLNLTTAFMADREQQKYGGRVPVDESVAQSAVMNKAIAWLKE